MDLHAGAFGVDTILGYIDCMPALKILCVSDHIDPLVYSNSIKQRFADVDFVLSSGDLPLTYYDFIMTGLNKPLYFVFGNHNLDKIGNFKRKYRDYSVMLNQLRLGGTDGVGATYLGGRVLNRNGVLMAGLGGSIWYNGGKNQYTNFGMFLCILRLLPRLLWNRIVHRRYLDMLLTHAPPLGVGDLGDPCHTGFRALSWFLRTFKPQYLIHGHVHLYELNAQRIHRYAETSVINAYNHYVVHLEV